jgi:site-specific DNA-methyltransferase (adenine-specific)
MIDLRLGDCREVLAGMPADSVDLTVTSPPYDNLRTYNGFTFDFEGIAQELYRVTKPGGVVVWVVGDATVKGSETGTSFRQALYFKDVCGFNLHDTMMWLKPNPMPGGAKNQYQSSFEYMFVLSKGTPKTAGILTAPCQTAGAVNTRVGSAGKDGWKASPGVRVVRDTKRRSNVWSIPKAASGRGHPAVFPEAIARDHILSWSNEGETVLDPFLGSGTTGKMALQHGRKFVGIEISQEYLEIARRRIEGATVEPAEAGFFTP